MNNLKNLYPCLDSIYKYTSISYETFVVAYLFSKENLEKVRKNYPWVTFIESNEIRGFSENNNLALRQAKGKYCFVLNDDTEMKMPVIDKLVETIENLPANAVCVSPKSLDRNGNLQSCGRPEFSFKTKLLSELKLWHEQKVSSKYINKNGIFETANIVGGFFLIKRDVFQRMGYFNEKYFFCPEDIELGMKLRNAGYKLYVNSDVVISHYEGGSYKLSPIRTATMPTSAQGGLLLYGDSQIKRFTLYVLIKLTALIKMLYWRKSIKEKWDNAYIMYKSHKNIFDSIGSKMTPKEIFVKYYKEIKR